jgi:S-adenosylmethionine/arginine decarboxylase-like enzyme
LVDSARRAPLVTLALSHLVADFLGVPAAQLRDAALVGGLLIAAVSAAGLAARGTPVVQTVHGDGLSGLCLLEGGYMMVHTYPMAEVLLLDVLSPAAHEPSKALDVFARRLASREIRSERRARG